MKHLIFAVAFILSFTCGSCTPSDDNNQPGTPEQPGDNGNNEGGNGTDPGNKESMRIQLTIGPAVFTATLSDNAAAMAFREMLPLTMNMADVNGNEKYIRLDRSLPTSAANPGTIRTGDLMLWGSNGLVLFYKTFSTSYSYTRLGRVDNPSGLENTLGAGNVTVKFEILETD